MGVCVCVLFQSGVDPQPQRRVLPDAGAVMRARQPSVVLCTAAVDRRHE